MLVLHILQYLLSLLLPLADCLRKASLRLNLLPLVSTDKQAIFHLAIHATAQDRLLHPVEFGDEEVLLEAVRELIDELSRDVLDGLRDLLVGVGSVD